MKTLRDVFDRGFAHVKFNRALADKLHRFQTRFVHKNSEHMEFFGGKTIGVQIVRFTPPDYDAIYDDIFDIDNDGLSQALLEVSAINPEWKVSTDVFNHICIYAIHRFLTTPMLSDSDREKAAINVALILNYRTIASIITAWFQYPVDPRLAEATYANLNNRFLIRRMSSWQEVLLYRSRELVGKNSIHREVFEKYNDDYSTIKAINDARGRIVDLVKNIYAEMEKTRQRGEKLLSSKDTMTDFEGEEVLKDKTHNLLNYTHYLFSIVSDHDSFIKPELVDLVVKVMTTVQRKAFVKALEWISLNCGHKEHPEIEELITTTLVHSFNYFLSNNYVLRDRSNLSGLLGKLKNIYVSSRSTDVDLLKLRELGTQVVSKATHKSNEQSIAAVRTSILLYIGLRAYTKHHYSE